MRVGDTSWKQTKMYRGSICSKQTVEGRRHLTNNNKKKKPPDYKCPNLLFLAANFFLEARVSAGVEVVGVVVAGVDVAGGEVTGGELAGEELAAAVA
jgi:hypothetical protein